MVLPSADWKNQPRNTLNWAVLVITSLLVVIYLYRWYQGAAGASTISLAVILMVWGVIYITKYWQPVLYLLVSVIVIAITALWLWNGIGSHPLDRIAVGLNTMFVVLSLYLSEYEEPAEPPDTDLE